MFKYTIAAYIILLLLFIYELSFIIPVKTRLEKKVLGISAQVNQFENYQNSLK